MDGNRIMRSGWKFWELNFGEIVWVENIVFVFVFLNSLDVKEGL